MYNEFEEYKNILKKGVLLPYVKVEFLRREDESPYKQIDSDIEESSGILNINLQNGIRRTVKFNLNNLSGKYIPNPNEIWVRQLVKLYLGFKLKEDIYYIPQGVFVLENPSALSQCSYQTVSMNLIDKFALLDGTLGGELDTGYLIPSGTNVPQAIKTILQLSGDTKSPIIDTSFMNEVTPFSISKEVGDTFGSIILNLANTFSANVYYDIQGQLRFEKNMNPELKSSVWDFTTNEFAYLGATQDFRFSELYNAVLVVGGTKNGQIFDYEAKNENIINPTSIPNLHFKRIKVITDQYINTTQLAKLRAEYELSKLICLQSEISINSIPMYHLDVNDIITLTDNNLKLEKERFIITRLSIPFGIDSQTTINAVKSIELISY